MKVDSQMNISKLLQKTFNDLREKFNKILNKFNIEQNIPESTKTEINVSLQTLEIYDSNSSFESLESNIKEKMSQSITDFLGNAARLLPEFDGRSENLQSFLDAISLINVIKKDNENIAITLIKTKLKGTARTLITTENTILDIVEKLKSSVKGESVEVLTAKILNTKQQNKTATNFYNEIETLTEAL